MFKQMKRCPMTRIHCLFFVETENIWLKYPQISIRYEPHYRVILAGAGDGFVWEYLNSRKSLSFVWLIFSNKIKLTMRSEAVHIK